MERDPEGVVVDRDSKTIVVTLDFENDTPTMDSSEWEITETGAGTGSFTVSGTFTGDVRFHRYNSWWR
jgi:hypothetical protein